LASVNSAMGNYEKSLADYYRILQIYENNSSYYDIGYTLNGIGVIYKNMAKYEDAISTYLKALAIYDSLDSEEDKANVLVNIANVYSDTNRFEEAKNYYEQALRIDQATGSEWGVAYDLENIGHMLNEMHQNDSALIYHLQALSIREKLPQKNEVAISYKRVGYTYFLLNNYNLAEQYLVKGLSLAQEISSKSLLRDLYDILSKLYAGKNRFSKAYEYQLLYSVMKDSVLSEVTARQINELQAKYETAEKDKQITLLAKENEIGLKESERQATLKKAFSGGFILMSILATLLAYIFRQRLRNQKVLAVKNEEVREANFKQRLGELEMKALRAQINPHFLFNCMNSINRMILEGESENASRYLAKFSKLVRLILENSESDQVSLDNELAMLESYIQLEELRLKGKINYSISIDGHIEPENTFLPPMILQPFVENAIWHGLMHREKREEGKIDIVVKEEGDRLWFTVEDNGVGREKAMKLRQNSVWKSKSMGIKITEERLRLLSKEKLQELIRVTDLKDSSEKALGTRVDINIPVS
jgi:tetratricopeptide (TPR) repeat protein